MTERRSRKSAATKNRRTKSSKLGDRGQASPLHPRNPHQRRYDFELLCRALPALADYIRSNPRGDDTIDFSDNTAVLCLNRALLAHYYQVENWQIPPGYLCPPIPGRADYIHYLADLLARSHRGVVPRGNRVMALDIGTGANIIYPIVGSRSYGWQFTASDIDPVSIEFGQAIVQANKVLKNKLLIRLQSDKKKIFHGVIGRNDYIDVTLCNPPFHASMQQAQAANQRKRDNLARHREAAKSSVPKRQAASLNFGGQQAELWCAGGESRFLSTMAAESADFASQVCWFSSLVSKAENVTPLRKRLNELGAKQIEVVAMRQGQKISRLVAWSYLTPVEQEQWAKLRWL